MSWSKLRSHKQVDLAQTMPLPSSDKAGKAKKKSHFSFKNLFKSHKSKASVLADSNKNRVEKKPFFGRKKKAVEPESFNKNSKFHESQAPKYRPQSLHQEPNDKPGNNSPFYKSYSGPTVVLPKSSPQPEAKRADTPAPKSTVSGGVGNVDPGIEPSVDLEADLKEKQSAIEGYQQEYQECYDLWKSLDAVPKDALGKPVKLSDAEKAKLNDLLGKMGVVLTQHLRPLQNNIAAASNGVKAALNGNNKLSTEAKKAYEQIDPKQFGQIKAEIAEINKEIANFKVEVAVAQQQKTLNTCMAEKNVLSDALSKLFSRGSSDSEFMKFNNKLVEIYNRIHDLRPKHLDSERFVNNPGGVQTEVDQIKADLAEIRNELKDRHFEELTNAENELNQIKENIKKLPHFPEKTRYLLAINEGLRDLKNTRAAYEPKDISKWSPMPNSVSMNFLDEINNITNSVRNAIPEAVREGEGMPNITEPATPSVSNTKPSAEEIEAARSAFNQTYERYEMLSGPALENEGATLDKDYENQMKHLQLMREYVTNNVSVEDGKWDLLKQINGQMQETKKEYGDEHENFEANEFVQGYKAVKTAMDNLQQAIDGKGDLKTCRQKMEDAQEKLFGAFYGKDKASEEEVNKVLQCGAKGPALYNNIHACLASDVYGFIGDMEVSDDVKAAFKSLDPKNLPQEVENYNEHVTDECQKKLEKLTSLRASVQKELKDGPEKTKFLNDINQGISKLREFREIYQVDEKNIGNLDSRKQGFDFNLDDIMKLTKTMFKRDRLEALKQAQKPEKVKARSVDAQEAFDNYETQVNNRCDQQIQYLEGLRQFATAENISKPEELEEFKNAISSAIEKLKTERDEQIEGVQNMAARMLPEIQEKVMARLDYIVYGAHVEVLQSYDSMTQDTKEQIYALSLDKQNRLGWDLHGGELDPALEQS